jgi:hypothetical protein
LGTAQRWTLLSGAARLFGALHRGLHEHIDPFGGSVIRAVFFMRSSLPKSSLFSDFEIFSVLSS